jgi:glycosyltransferase involved in cell wall biosynthesis
MHILLLPSWYPKTPKDVGGVFFRDQALALHNYGYKVGVIAPFLRSLRTVGKSNSEAALPEYENDNGIHTYRKEVFTVLPRVPYGNYWLFKYAARALLKRYIKENGKPDILHAHAAVFGGAAGAELAEEFDIPLVLTEHSSGFARGVYKNWQLKLTETAIDCARTCIAVSPSLGTLLTEQFPLSDGKWKWIPNVVADRFSAPVESLKKQRPVRFLNLALMTENKGQRDLLEAFVMLVNGGVDAELWLAGDGPIRAELEALAESSGVLDRVKFLGLVAPGDVPGLLGKVDVMVVSSHYETFGVVAAEALMAGLPVIATRCGGPECIVEDGDGLLVSPKQPAELGKAMMQLAENLLDYNPVLIADRAKARFSGTAVAARLTSEYKKVMSPSISSNHIG